MSPQLKQALISVAIGATVSFLTVLFQGILDVLHQLGPSLPGSIVGAVSYLLKSKEHQYI